MSIARAITASLLIRRSWGTVNLLMMRFSMLLRVVLLPS